MVWSDFFDICKKIFTVKKLLFYYLNRRPDGQEEVTVEDLKEERNDDILQHYEHLANYAEQSETGKGTSSSGKVEKV